MPVPEIDETEDTAIREPCPFCGVVYEVKNGKVCHYTPTCKAWEKPTFLEDARKEAARLATGKALRPSKVPILPVLMALAAVVAIVACAAAAQTTYEAELVRCVDQARTREESRACRARVNQRWNVDAGVADGQSE